MGTVSGVCTGPAVQHCLARLLVIITLHAGFALHTGTARGAGQVSPYDSEHGSVWLRVDGSESYREALQLETDVGFQVSGLIARATVRQQFRNDSDTWAEGLYVFPLPDDAAVDHFRLRIGERVIEGQVMERAAAKKTYEQAKQAGKRTGLVEQQRPNVFTTSLANIAPGETLVVEIEYQQTLVYREGVYRLRFPMVVGPRYRSPPTKRPEGAGVPEADAPAVQTSTALPGIDVSPVSIRIDLDAGMALADITSAYHAIDIEQQSGGAYSVRLADQQVPADRDFELAWRPVLDTQPRAVLFQEQMDGEAYAMLSVFPPDLLALGKINLPRDVIFVIDVSGSMHGASLEQARGALLLALARLPPQDRFNLIWFNNQSGALYPDAQPADYQNIQHAMRFVERLEADGGTEMLPALRRALDARQDPGRLRQVVFLTDGAVEDEAALFEVIRTRLGDTRLFTVGIGSAPNAYFMRKAARAGRGTFTFIGDGQEVQEKIEGLLRRLESPALVDIQVEVAGAAVEAFPDPVPDLYLGEPVSVLIRGHDPGAEVVIRGAYGKVPWERTVALREGREHDGIRVAWAREKIASLMEQRREAGDVAARDALQAGIVETALTHHLTSRFTSLVAVDVTPVRAGGLLQTHHKQANLPRGWHPGFANNAATAHIGMPRTATSATLHMLLASLLLLLAGLGDAWWRRS